MVPRGSPRSHATTCGVSTVHSAVERAETRNSEIYAQALEPTPTSSGLVRRFQFESFAHALDYAATGKSGMNFYSGRLDLLQAVSYREIREMARGLARSLLNNGLVRADRVALVADTDPDFVVAFAACQYGGLLPSPMPLPSAFGGREGYIAQIRHMLATARVSAAIAPEWVLPYLVEAAEGLHLKFVGTVAQLSALPEGRIDLKPSEPQELSYLQFSSGSTRMPAGISITHRALMSNTAAIAGSCLAVRAGDRAVSWLPFYHDMGLVGFVLATLVSQLSVDFLPTREFARRPLNWLKLLDKNGGTISYSSSFGYDLCAKRIATGQMPQVDLRRWRVAGIGGDMVRPAVLEHFAEAFAPLGFRRQAFVPSYGLAEATLAVSFCTLDRGLLVDRVDTEKLETDRQAVPPSADSKRVRDFVVCGKVIPGHDVEVRDEDGAAVGERQIGHVFVRGPSLMSGYDRRPEETAEVLKGDGWLDTGDLGYVIHGELVITGRFKDIIIVNGRNLWPQDLEYTAETVTGLRAGDVAAFSIDSGETDEELVVVLVQCRSSEEETRRRLAHDVAKVLAKVHGVTARVALVPRNALPMTSSGKLRRRSARAAYLAGAYAAGVQA